MNDVDAFISSRGGQLLGWRSTNGDMEFYISCKRHQGNFLINFSALMDCRTWCDMCERESSCDLVVTYVSNRNATLIQCNYRERFPFLVQCLQGHLFSCDAITILRWCAHCHPRRTMRFIMEPRDIDVNLYMISVEILLVSFGFPYKKNVNLHSICVPFVFQYEDVIYYILFSECSGTVRGQLEKFWSFLIILSEVAICQEDLWNKILFVIQRNHKRQNLKRMHPRGCNPHIQNYVRGLYDQIQKEISNQST